MAGLARHRGREDRAMCDRELPVDAASTDKGDRLQPGWAACSAEFMP